MKRIGIIIVSVMIITLLSGLVSGCAGTPATGDGSGAELESARELIDDLQSQLNAARDQAGALMQQVSELGEGAGLTGATPRETAINIVDQYHKNNPYSMADLFVCADMAMGVWNMLKAQNIDAVVQIGSAERTISKMEDSEHAWVIAEVGPGEYLALETTNGKAVTREENPLYYTGWAFATPAKYKEFEKFKHEHNVRVEIVNSMIDDAKDIYALYQTEFNKYQALFNEYNTTYGGQPWSEASDVKLAEVNNQLAVAKEVEGRYNQINLQITEQQQEIASIPPKMQALTQ